MKSKYLLWAVVLLFIAVAMTVTGVILKVNEIAISKPLIVAGAIMQAISMILLITYGITTRRREKM